MSHPSLYNFANPPKVSMSKLALHPNRGIRHELDERSPKGSVLPLSVSVSSKQNETVCTLEVRLGVSSSSTDQPTLGRKYSISLLLKAMHFSEKVNERRKTIQTDPLHEKFSLIFKFQTIKKITVAINSRYFTMVLMLNYLTVFPYVLFCLSNEIIIFC